MEETTRRTNLALFQLVEEGRANLGLGLLKPCTAGQHNVVAVLVQLDDLGFDFLADVWSRVAHTAHLDERCWQEATQADVQDEATLDNLDDGTGNDAVLFLDLFDVAPSTLVLSTLLGQDQAAFLVFLGRPKASTLSPTVTTSPGSTSCLMESSREGMTPSVL